MQRRIGRNFSLSLGGAAIGLVIGLAQTALLTKSLSLAEYGQLLITLNLFSFLTTFVGIRVNDILFQLYPLFRQEGAGRAQRDLLWLCLGLSGLMGLFIGGGVLLLAGWLARTFYEPTLAPLLRLYALAVLFSAFTGFYETILRLHDRFAAVIVPTLISSGVVFAALLVYLTTTTAPNLTVVVGLVSLGVVIRALPPLGHSLWLVRANLRRPSGERWLEGLHPYRRQVVDVLFNANLAGYLKLAFGPGDVFFLGLFGTAEQVALYGLANQLLRPILLVQNNLQIALMPEVTDLWARGRLPELRALARRYVGWTLLGGSLVMVLALALARPALLLLARPAYLPALPVFYVLAVVAWLTLVFVIFYPVGLSMGMLRWFNLANGINLLVLAVGIAAGPLTAWRMAWIQLGATLIRRVAANLYVWHRLHTTAGPTLAAEEYDPA